jgi:S-DNA-T family DNA segregation ATPase FtsK/SpoIIIE
MINRISNQEIKFAQKNRHTILPTKQAHLLNDVIAVLLFAVSLVLGGTLFTYSAHDPSWFQNYGAVAIHNMFGLFGAYSADILYSSFGNSCWWMVFGLFYLGFRKITRIKLHSGNLYNILQLIMFIILVISSSMFEYATFYYQPNLHLHNGNGGIIGNTLYNEFADICGDTITIVGVFLTITISFCITFSFSLLTITEKTGWLITTIFYSIRQLFRYRKAPKTNDEIDLAEAQILTPAPIPDIAEQPYTDDHTILNSELDLNLNLDTSESLQTEVSKKISKIVHRNVKSGILPSSSLLTIPKIQSDQMTPETLEFVSHTIENKLAEFKVEAKITNAESGPVITRYELIPSRGVRGERIVALSKEIARGLALSNIRIVETIPGKNGMGIEVPNFKRQTIYVKEIFDSAIYKRNFNKLTLALGKDIAGNVVITDLAKMPHLLVAGTTGSGKSVAINTMILSILFQATPDEVKFIMIDPKMVELSFYQNIPHLLAPVIIDTTHAVNALKWTVGEMERRYKIMAKLGCKTITAFNQKIEDAKNMKQVIPNPFDFSDTPEPLDKWPYIVVIIDELADLMMVTGKKIEQYIARIAQKARAIGIHLIIATQRPSVDVITGLIKANIPARIAFQVSSKVDSRTILDQMGAETLLGHGDMLFLQPGHGYPQRIHGALVNDDELNRVIEFLHSTGEPDYIEAITSGDVDNVELPGFEETHKELEKDDIFDEVVKFIDQTKRCSISSLQTKFGVGYNRAARIMAHLEEIGMVKRNERGTFELIRK